MAEQVSFTDALIAMAGLTSATIEWSAVQMVRMIDPAQYGDLVESMNRVACAMRQRAPRQHGGQYAAYPPGAGAATGAAAGSGWGPQ
jgi:hypothetical protein